ncbi:MAG: tyrosine-type recombinase/integrase [Phycisphaerales bacterium]|nr:tyrosine-type recombinase/integrase [Phycisphaerales bacterium]
MPLSDSLAARLRAVRPADHSPTDGVFRSVPTFDTWCRDLKRAQIDYKADDDTLAGFHSLRVTFISELERAGVSPRTIMELARHRDYRLTASVYTDVRVIDTFGAVGRLPDYEHEPDAQTARRTGTDDRVMNSADQQDQIRDQKVCRNVQFHAFSHNSDDAADARRVKPSDAKNPAYLSKNADFSGSTSIKKDAGMTGVQSPGGPDTRDFLSVIFIRIRLQNPELWRRNAPSTRLKNVRFVRTFGGGQIGKMFPIRHLTHVRSDLTGNCPV